jgi:hypothetical protein
VAGNQWDYSFMTFMSPSEDMQVQTVANAIDPFTGMPVIVAWIGRTNAHGDPAATIGFDFPQEIHGPADKPVKELYDVKLFVRDSVPIERITCEPVGNPNDPPDVIATVDGHKFGIEATQFLVPEVQLDTANSIVGRWYTFDRLRQKILQESAPEDFAQHEGLLAVAYFGDVVGSASERLPPRRPVDVESAIAELKQISPVLRPASSGRQNFTESDVLRYSADRSVGFIWTKLPPLYSSPFHQKMKFELALGYHLTVTLSDLRSELRRLIEQHDNQQSDILLITLNAPLKSGLWFPANKIVADLLLLDDQPLGGWKPSHIRRIALHSQQPPIRKIPLDKQETGTVRWIHGTSPWTWM